MPRSVRRLRLGRQLGGHPFHIAPDAQQVTAPELRDVLLAVPATHEFERELSDLRTQMHHVIDAIDRVIVDRRVAGTAG